MNLLRHLMPRGLFWRSFLIMMIPLILVQATVVYIFFERHWDTVSRQLAMDVTGDVITIMRMADGVTDPAERARIDEIARKEMQFGVVFEDGAVLPDDAPPQRGSISYEMLHQQLDRRLRAPYHLNSNLPNKGMAIRVQRPDGVLTLLTTIKRMRESTTVLVFLWMAGMALLVATIAVLFLRNQIRPIRRLAEAADGLGKGRPVTDLRPSGATEVRRAGAAFMEMQGRIQRQITQRTEMLAGVSHDLRTPLTRMRLQLAMLADAHPESRREIAESEQDLQLMEHMIDEYMAFARGQGGEAPVSTDLAEIIDDVTADARSKGSPITLEVERPLVVALRPNAIRRCLTNLVENAVHHGRQVAISAVRRDDIVSVAVEDDGPGIPEDQREEVFKPFFRLDDARNPRTGGAGLGLSIARDVARGHGGDIRMSGGSLGGLRAELRLPV